MFHLASPVVAACTLLLPTIAAADPINLKLSFFTSDRSQIYQYAVEPFVDAVNAEGSGLVHIEVFFSGAISGDLSRQPQLVFDGTADLALTIPGRTPDRFHDTSVLELPGLFHDSGQASRVFTQRNWRATARCPDMRITMSSRVKFPVPKAYTAASRSLQSRISRVSPSA